MADSKRDPLDSLSAALDSPELYTEPTVPAPKPTKAPKVQLNGLVSPEVRQRTRMKAIERGETIGEVIERLLLAHYLDG